MNRQQLLGKIDRAWFDLADSYAGLSESRMLERGVTSGWSVRDVIAHVTWWEQEALKHLPAVAGGVRPPRYSDLYGGIDAFNALMTEQRSALSLTDVLRDSTETHARLIDYLQNVPQELVATETPFRHRLRLDTYAHYSKHAKAIREWRERNGCSSLGNT